MKNRDLQGKDNKIFKIILEKDIQESSTLEEFKYVVGCDPYKVQEPKNCFEKIKKRLGLNYKVQDVRWEYVVSKIDNKGNIEILK